MSKERKGSKQDMLQEFGESSPASIFSLVETVAPLRADLSGESSGKGFCPVVQFKGFGNQEPSKYFS